MPDEPNRNIDEQLRAWARKRREDAGAPLELHAATRKLLQDEVARTFSRKPTTSSAATAGWWRMLWPRFALAGSICVALVAIVGILLPGLAKSKSREQQIALVRQQDKDLSADSGRRDTPAQNAPDSAASRAVQAPLPQHRAESGKSTLAEAQPPAAPSLAENKLIEQPVGVRAELKDERLKAEPPATVQTQSLPEKQFSDKAKAAAPLTAAPARDSYAEKEKNQARLRQRYAPGQAPAGGVSNSASALTIAQKSPATSRIVQAEAPQLALDGATVRQPAGGSARGFADGTASNQAPPVALAFNRPQKAAPADDLSLAAAPAGRVVTGNVESLAARSETDRLGTGTVNSYFATVPSASQRFAQVREYRVNFNSPPMPNVLSSFQLVQNGRQIRVVDTDGSIYDGGIEQTEESTRRGLAPAAELKKNIEPELKRASAATAGEVLATQNAFFRVTGTNLTLQQLVVFEGNLLGSSNQANETVAGAGLKAEQSAATVRQSVSQKGQETAGALIRGQATIGSSNRIEVNATRVPQ